MAKPNGLNLEFLYPPPQPSPDSNKETILGVVVEKKGDESGTSMRLKEIYAFSKDIIIRDGFMVMQKIYWNDFEPGDWFVCSRSIVKDIHGNIKERELIDVKKIGPSKYKQYDLPSTSVVNGNVRIIRPFIVCPRFIRNRVLYTRDAVNYKLYMRDFNQAFVSIHSTSRERFHLEEDVVYNGIFEFRGIQNGAVNFAPKSRLKDATGHTLERTAMWELMGTKNDVKIPLAKHDAMKEDVAYLYKYAKRYHEEMEKKGAFTRHPPKSALNPPKTPVPPPPIHLPIERQRWKGDDLGMIPEEAVSVTKQFRSRAEVEMHRRECICQMNVRENGVNSLTWFDKESKKTNRTRDFLDFAFDVRYKEQLEQFPACAEPPPPTSPDSPGPELDISPDESMIHISPPRMRVQSISEMSTFLPSEPQANSTPYPSPPTIRRVVDPEDTVPHDNSPYNDGPDEFTFTVFGNKNSSSKEPRKNIHRRL